MSELVESEGKGFNFDLVNRNNLLLKKGIKSPDFRKTGTTLAALIFKDGVILAADCRATSGSTVFDKNIEKIGSIAPNIYCAGAGTAADCYHVCRMISSALNLHRYESGRKSRVVTAATMLKNHLQRYGGYIGAALLLGGYDIYGPQLYTIYPDGTLDTSLFSTFGSGSLNAMSIFETEFKEDMEEEEAMILAAKAIKAGIFNDLGSGSNVDMTVIKKDEVKIHRNYEYLQSKTYTRKYEVSYPPGTTEILDEKIRMFKELVVVDSDEMDTS